MEIEFTAARWTLDRDGAWLNIRVPSPETATTWLDQMKDGETYTAKLSRKRHKRSLDANAYYWVLAGKIGAVLNLSPEEVYQRHIRDIGNYNAYCMQDDAVELFGQMWASGHLGRFVATRASKIPGCTTVLAYYGSSDFDTRQMSRLIDNAVQDCMALGIETKSPEEVESLLAQWDEKAD